MSECFNGYYRYPTVFKDSIAFVAEDDIWIVSTQGGIARRLTTNAGEISDLSFSKDGKWIAFTGRDEGVPDVYLIPSTGGVPKRLTFFGTNSKVLGWKDENIIFSSNYKQPFSRITAIWEVDIKDKRKIKQLDYGISTEIDFGKEKGVVLGRKTSEPARWKNYRGGTAGELLIDKEGNYEFKKLIDIKSNLANPMWIQDRIYFISDHEDVANIYSCTIDGKDLKKHTNHTEFYVRNAKTDGNYISYHAGADIYLLDVSKDETKKIEIQYYSTLPQRNRKFVDAEHYFETFSSNKNGEKLLTTHRGKSFYFENWFGAVKQIGKKHGIRYRLSTYLNIKEEKIVTVSDEENKEHLEIYDLKNNLLSKIDENDLGRVVEIIPSPKEESILLTNQRNELILIDLKNKSKIEIDKNSMGPIIGFSFSPDGNWIAYSKNINKKQTAIFIYDINKDKSQQVTDPILMDINPIFDPNGDYLYFLSYRIFNPVSDNLQFNISFTKGMKPYLITLRKDVFSPFDERFREKGEEEKSDEQSGEHEKEEDLKIEIDFDNISQRIIPFPVSEERYIDIQATKDKVFYTIAPIKGELDDEEDMLSSKPAHYTLKYYDLKDKEEKTFMDGVTDFIITQDTQKIIIRIDEQLRVLSTANPPSEDEKDETKKYSRKSGWIDLSRIKLEVDPLAEWKQMICEAWRLQKFYFWNKEKLKEINWDEILKRYYPLVERIASRNEFSDLIWEMQGELKSSHAYEFGGDYKPKPVYKIGYLGADLIFDEVKNLYKISHIVKGDIWDESNKPPLLEPGANIKEGDYILSINGQSLNEKTPNELLINYYNQNVEIIVTDGDNLEKKKTSIIKTLKDETPVRYREWVETNKKYVHDKTSNKVGYVHIPDMGFEGFAEFHRNFLSEVQHDALIIDVRVNSGGFVSSLILEKLNRKFIGFDFSPYMVEETYQNDSVKGPMVAITNEFAGSDGDIFSHSFKLLKLGKLIGKRTWGGVVGIWPRNPLVDNTITTQPEMAFWFKDVGWNVENYGTDPDIEIDITPKDYKEGKDPQLDKAIEIVLKELEENPPIDPKEIKM
ncbi:hypothetical protein PW5551_10060 [Petrotoga sp. 9PW.55.5.1]|uniref:S41 family peptidase n=1 Tax=Petrotoga sp. 9PW.55.5.1 TaxID=1308979 RepID=UPI000DC5AEAC|nr:S41 family peptidase [Petrotoga sp. 9PW.55.5.1]RAO98427.1 hypothetical protein PW5551_10060 [Petrotoga sp. 9PW.55.5.1]